MADDKFTIAVDPQRHLLRIAMRGQWDIATVQRYKLALLDAVDRMIAGGCPHDKMLALVDTRGGGAQSQEVVASFKDNFGGSELAPYRLATLVSSALFKRQVERIAISNQRLFTDEAEALSWLLSPDATP